MSKIPVYDLEERSTKFAIDTVRLCKSAPRDSINNRINGQLVGCTGSVGANYREANDALGSKDFVCRLKIARKEAKEAIHWLQIFKAANIEKSAEVDMLIKEATEIKRILSSIIIKRKEL